MTEHEIGRKLGREIKSATDASAIAFVFLAQTEQLDDVTISEHPALFPDWDEHWRGHRGDIVRDGEGLYRSLHDVKNAGQNTRPSQTPSMWTPIGDPNDEWPSWSAPLGAHDAYALGAKVSHKGGRWVSSANANVWEPGVYGWDSFS